RMFAEKFTHNYAKLAEKDLIFADARNVFDLALAAALIRKEVGVAENRQAFETFVSGGLYRTASYAVPKEVDSVVHHRVYYGRDIVVQAAGGVRANLDDVLNNPKRSKASPALDQLATTAKLPEGRWWWDVSK